MKSRHLQALTMEKYLTFLCSLHIFKNVQVLYVTKTMWNVNNKFCTQNNKPKIINI